MKTIIKLTIVGLIGAASTGVTSAHELRGTVKALGDKDTSDFFPKEEMIEEEEERSYRNYRGWENRNKRDYGGRDGGWRREGRRYTDKGQSRYRRSNSTASGRKYTAAAKRENRRAERRSDRNRGRSSRGRRTRDCKYCDELNSEDADIMLDFFDMYGDDEIDLIADYLLNDKS